MADLSFSTKLLVDLAPVLSAIDIKEPPPEPKARYILGRAVDGVDRLLTVFNKARQKHTDTFCVKDDDGKPIYRQGDVEGTVRFDIIKGQESAYSDGMLAMLEEPVTLSGVRVITRAEMGEFPLTVQQERVLIACGLLEDVEPA